MATSTDNSSGFAELDPVEGLVEYVKDVKPFHTKIVEILIEYVYDEEVDVRIIDKTHIDITIDRPTTEAVAPACDGYSQIPFGEPKWPVLSNNINKEFNDSTDPAISIITNTFKLRGNHTDSIKAGNKINLTSYVENFERIHPLLGTITEPDGSLSFEVANYVIKVDPTDNIPKPVVIESFEDVFLVSDKVYTVGSADDNRPFTITGFGNDGSPTEYQNQTTFTDVEGNVYTNLTKTKVNVKESIKIENSIGFLGMVRTVDIQNSGVFTVTEVEYNGGMIDEWTDRSDPYTYKIGNEPHTIVKILEPLTAPSYEPLHGSPISDSSSTSLFGVKETYTAFVQLAQVDIEQVHSYSGYRSYDARQVPDEGVMTSPIIGATVSQTNGTGGTIPGTGKIVVPYNIDLSNIFPGDKIRIANSTANNGEYTITSFEYDEGDQATTISVNERIRSNTADGSILIDIPSNVFVIDGNYQSRFSQGKKFNVAGGTYSGEYTTLSSDYVNGKTRIRPTTNIIGRNNNAKTTIAGVSTIPSEVGEYAGVPAFRVFNDITRHFYEGSTFNVYETMLYNGFYYVEYSKYVDYDDEGNYVNSTFVVPAIDINNTLTRITLDPTNFYNGFITSSNLGVIKDYLSGFGETSELVCLTSEGMVYTNIYEKLMFSGITLDLRDEIITYNWENNDRNVFQNPLDTIISSSEPTMLEQPTPPPTNQYVDVLWFDTSEYTLKQWIGSAAVGGQGSPSDKGMWKAKNTIYWLDTNTNTLKYYTRLGSVDDSSQPVLDVNTGWQLYTDPAPGFGTVQSAKGSAAITGKEHFSVVALATGDLTNTFTTSSYSAPISDVDVIINTTDPLRSQHYFAIDGNINQFMPGRDFGYNSKIFITNSIHNDLPPYDNVADIQNDYYTIAQVVYIKTDNVTRFYVNETITNTEEISGDLRIASIEMPTDSNMAKVYVNDVPVNFNILSSTSFEVIDYPLIGFGDRVDLVVYDNVQQQSNAWVEPFDSRPHNVFHTSVSNVPGRNAYEIPGGNFMFRFTPTQHFTVMSTGSPDHNDMYPVHFTIIDIDSQAATFTIPGEYDWLFTNRRILSIGTTSVNGYKNFEVSSSVFDGTNTIISIAFPDVIELPSGSPNDPAQFNYNETGIDVYNLNGNLIQINSNQVGSPASDPLGHIDNITDMFVVGDKIKISNSTDDNNGIWTVDSVIYDQSNGITNIRVAESVLFDPMGTDKPTLHPPIKDNQSANLNMMQFNNGYILGAVYDPQPTLDPSPDINEPYNNISYNQPRTIVVSNDPQEHTSAYALSYDWVGPLRLQINLNPTTPIHASLYEKTDIDGYMTITPSWDGGSFSGEQSDVEGLTQTAFVETLDFGWGVTHYWNIVDVEEDSTSIYLQGDITSTLELNDRIRVVSPFLEIHENEIIKMEYVDGRTRIQLEYPQMVLEGRYIAEPEQWIGNPLRYDQIGGDEYIATGQYAAPASDGSPIIQRWATAEEVYGKASNNWDVLSIDVENQQIVVRGHTIVTTVEYLGAEYFIINSDPNDNLLTSNVTESVNAGSIDDVVEESSDLGVLTDPAQTGSPGSVVIPETYVTEHFQPLDIISIRGSLGNDSNRYVVESVEYTTENTTILNLAVLSDSSPLAEPYSDTIIGKSLEYVSAVPGSPTTYGDLILNNIDVTDWYQYNIIIAKPLHLGSPQYDNAFIINGNATSDIQNGQQFRVYGTSNDGVYTAGTPVTDIETVYTDNENNNVQTLVTTYIPVLEPIANTERGGIIESVRDNGMRISLEDHIGVQVGENATGAMITTGGNMIDSWDYQYWSIGGFDENLETLSLYSNTL